MAFKKNNPGCPCCCTLPGCSRSVGTLTGTSNKAGVAAFTLTLHADLCMWSGCSLRPSGAGFPVVSASDCSSINASGAFKNARVFQMTAPSTFTQRSSGIGCDPLGGLDDATGTCPADTTTTAPFGPIAPGVSGLTNGQDYTIVISSGITVLSCNPYHARITLVDRNLNTEIIDLTE